MEDLCVIIKYNINIIEPIVNVNGDNTRITDVTACILFALDSVTRLTIFRILNITRRVIPNNNIEYPAICEPNIICGGEPVNRNKKYITNVNALVSITEL